MQPKTSSSPKACPVLPFITSISLFLQSPAPFSQRWGDPSLSSNINYNIFFFFHFSMCSLIHSKFEPSRAKLTFYRLIYDILFSGSFHILLHNHTSRSMVELQIKGYLSLQFSKLFDTISTITAKIDIVVLNHMVPGIP